jgi:hypothetical protein
MTTTIPSLAIDSAPQAFRRGIMVSLKALIFIAVSSVIRGAVMPLIATLLYQLLFMKAIETNYRRPMTNVAQVNNMMKAPNHHFRPDI